MKLQILDVNTSTPVFQTMLLYGHGESRVLTRRELGINFGAE
jgi:hypothetical protein